MIGYLAGVATGLLIAVAVYFVLRRELAIYHRARGITLDNFSAMRKGGR